MLWVLFLGVVAVAVSQRWAVWDVWVCPWEAGGYPMGGRVGQLGRVFPQCHVLFMGCIMDEEDLS